MKRNLIFKSLCWLAVIAFGCEGIDPQSAGAQAFISRPNLSAAGELLPLNAAYTPVMIRGMKFNPVDGLNMSFIVDTGNTNPDEIALKQESEKLIKYFLASLAIPEKDLWVNLSPYEKDRITSLALSRTDMGRDLLAQDYILKTITSALIDPNNETGRKFWDKVYDRLYNVGAIHELPLQETIDSFNKVWIMPDKAEVFAQGNTVLILNSRLKVMLEEDYFAKQLSLRGATGDEAISEIASQKTLAMTEDVKQIMREVVVPMIEDEVNSGENFAPLRQIFHALILAKWFKENLKESLLGQVYADRSKISGIDVDGKPAIDAIYNRYVEAFKVGAQGLLKEEYDPETQSLVARKYMTGGFTLGQEGVPVVSRAMLTADRAALAVPVTGALKEVYLKLGVRTPQGIINAAMMTDWERAYKALRSAQKRADRIRGDVTAVGKKIPGLEILAKKPNATFLTKREWQSAVRRKLFLETKELPDQEKLVELYRQRLNDIFDAAMMTPNHFEEDGVPEEGFAKGGIDLNTGEMEFKSGGRVDRAVLNQFQNINPDDIIGVVPLNIIIKPVLSMQSFLGIEKP